MCARAQKYEIFLRRKENKIMILLFSYLAAASKISKRKKHNVILLYLLIKILDIKAWTHFFFCCMIDEQSNTTENNANLKEKISMAMSLPLSKTLVPQYFFLLTKSKLTTTKSNKIKSTVAPSMPLKFIEGG
jgi:hypothetical protein